MSPYIQWDMSAIENAAKECFVGKSQVAVAEFLKALHARNVVTRNRLTRIVESTDYLALSRNNNVVTLTRSTFSKTPAQSAAAPLSVVNLSTAQVQQEMSSVPSRVSILAAYQNPMQMATTAASSPVLNLVASQVTKSTTLVPPVSVNCDTDAIVDLLGDIAIEYLDLEDNAATDIFLDVGSNMFVKTNGECIQHDKAIDHSDISAILEQLPEGGPNFKQGNRVIFGRTLHRLAAVTYDGAITGITIRVGRSVSGLLPVFEGLVEQKNVLLCGSPNVGKTTTLREICKYLSRGKCLCLIDTSGEVCGEAGNKSHIVGTARVFRPADPSKQYMTLLDCVRNHSPDIIAIDELNTKDEVEVCQTIALRSIQMVASVHGNIEDLVFNPMLNKALGGSTQALVSDRVAVDGKKVVMQRTSRPIFDVVINITRSSQGLEYTFIEDVANNVSRIMQGKPIKVRRRRMVGEELLETMEDVLYRCE
ncbi:hypothetical protein BGZ98_000626 [Dissophora globulifera]|nr:hypothetical protein BGZ98_000626 [Dissophora globulifera]